MKVNEMMSALDAAVYFLSIAGEEEPVTHLKLQKLLYYAQSANLAFAGRGIFPERVLAWEHGPVVRSVYDHFKRFKSAPLKVPGDFNLSVVPEEDALVIRAVYSYFGQFSAMKLREMTHEEEPWQLMYPEHDEIPQELMKRYFAENWYDVVFLPKPTRDDFYEFLTRNSEPTKAAMESAEKFKQSVGVLQKLD